MSAAPTQRRACPLCHVFVGREREVDNLRHLVLSADARLVTLTGVGGCGKTRLAIGVASSLSNSSGMESGWWNSPR